MNQQKFLRLPVVKERTGLSRSSIYREIQAGTFPAPKALTARTVGWLEQDIDAWTASRCAAGHHMVKEK